MLHCRCAGQPNPWSLSLPSPSSGTRRRRRRRRAHTACRAGDGKGRAKPLLGKKSSGRHAIRDAATTNPPLRIRAWPHPSFQLSPLGTSDRMELLSLSVFSCSLSVTGRRAGDDGGPLELCWSSVWSLPSCGSSVQSVVTKAPAPMPRCPPAHMHQGARTCGKFYSSYTYTANIHTERDVGGMPQ